ncbi:unnamed protein product, partial [Phaeothamnion confervicola]
LQVDKSSTAYLFVGVAAAGADTETFLGGDDRGWGYIGDRALYHGRVKVKPYGERFGQGDTIGVLLDSDRGCLSFCRNGVDLGVAFEGLAGELFPAVAFYNQGQRVSLVRGAFRCGGGGVMVSADPAAAGPEDLIDAAAFLRCMGAGSSGGGAGGGRRSLPATLLMRAHSAYTVWVAGTAARVETLGGYEIDLITSAAALRAGDRVRTPRGNATVIGAADGALWFRVDGEAGAWFFVASEIVRGRPEGLFVPLQPRPAGISGSDGGNGGDSSSKAHSSGSNNHGETGSHGNYDSTSASVNGIPFESTPAAAVAVMTLDAFAAAADCPAWTADMDACVVAALNDHADRAGKTPWDVGTAAALAAVAPTRPRLARLAAEAGAPSPTDGALLCRVAVLRVFNHDVVRLLPFLNPADGPAAAATSAHVGDPRCGDGAAAAVDHRATAGPVASLGAELAVLRGSIFMCTKQKLLRAATAATATAAKKPEDEYDYPEDFPQVTLNRPRAAAAAAAAAAVTSARHSMFGQLQRELGARGAAAVPVRLRLNYTHPMDDGQERTFKVKFEGEGVDDYGGPYREVFTQLAAELTATCGGGDGGLGGGDGRGLLGGNAADGPRSRAELAPGSASCVLPLLAPCNGDNGWSGGGDASGGAEGDVRFAPRAAAVPRRLPAFEFMGRVLGMGLRSRVAAFWPLSSGFWNGLVGQPMSSSRRKMLQIAVAVAVAKNIAADAAPNEAADFVQGGSGATAEIVDAAEAAAAACTATEVAVAAAVAAARAGLADVVPVAALALLTGAELELAICGRPGVDVELLRANTEYDDGVAESDPHIQSFWRVLRTFDGRDRTAFLRFVWARSRLPTRPEEFRQKLKIQTAIIGDTAAADALLPRAHTCFFSLSLPRYSSDAVMAARLRYAIHSCVEMDADFRLADGEATGWV